MANPKHEIIIREIDGVKVRFRNQPLAKGGTEDVLIPLCTWNGDNGEVCNLAMNKLSRVCHRHNPSKIMEKIQRKSERESFLTDGVVSAHDFVFKFAKTLDPHDKKHPIKNIPRHEYLEKMVDVWLKDQLVCVVKSRQMMASWLFTALHLWDAMYHDGRSIFFISKKEEDAGFGNQLSLLARVEFMIEQLPENLRPKYKKSSRPPKLEFAGRYSSIMACSQEAESLRQYTASRILSDEMAFQEQAEKAYIAMKPTLDGGGCFTGISTPNGRQNLFYHLVNDVKIGESRTGKTEMISHGSIMGVRQESIGKGIWVRHNRNGFTIIGLHHSADPKKTPEWVEQMKKSYVSDDAWKQEQELDFSKTEGARVYPSFRVDRHVRKLQYNPYRTIWRGWDFGFVHPAVVFAQIDENDRLCVLKEMMGEEVTINEFAKAVIKTSNEYFPGCSFRDAGDPAGRARTDKSEKTTVDILRSFGIKMQMQNSGVDEGINCIRGLLVPRTDDKPSLFVDPCCEILMDGMLGGYIRKENGDAIKDGFYEHIMDALRYLIVVVYDVRTYKPYRPARVYIPKHQIIDKVTGF